MMSWQDLTPDERTELSARIEEMGQLVGYVPEEARTLITTLVVVPNPAQFALSYLRELAS